MITRLKNIFQIAIVTILASSCFSIRYSFTGATIDPKIQTMSVQYFENRAPRIEPELSQQFTEALKNYFESNTQLRLINGIGDVNFEGEITGYDFKPTAITGEEAAENRFTITIKVKYTNSIDHDTDFEKSFSRYQNYSTERSFEDVKDLLTEEIVKEIVEQIFNTAFVNW